MSVEKRVACLCNLCSRYEKLPGGFLDKADVGKKTQQCYILQEEANNPEKINLFLGQQFVGVSQNF